MATLPVKPTNDWNVISVVATAHGTSHFFHMLVPAVFPWIQPEFGLSYTALGVLTGIFYAVSGVGQALAGFVVDRFGALRTLIGGLACLALAGPVLALSHGYGGLVIAAILAGLGNCVFHPADFTLLNRNVGEKRLGHAFSAHGFAGNIGWAVTPLFMLALAPHWGWRGAAAATSVIAVAMIALLWAHRDSLVQGNPSHQKGRVDEPAVGTGKILTEPAVLWSFLFFMASVAAFGALQSFAPALFRDIHALATPLGQSALTVYLVAASAGLIAGGFLVQTRSPDTLISWVLGSSAIAAIGLASGIGGAVAVFGGMIVIGLAVGVAGPSRDLLVRRATLARLAPAAYGRVYGLVYSGLDTGLALAPIVFGWMLDKGAPQAVLFTVAALQVFAVVAAWRIAKKRDSSPATPQNRSARQ
jgi:MFS transporter, FSR family, fosmidomycin resistance protein